MSEKIFITGATGFLGSYVARMLVKEGRQVVALRRKSSKLDCLGDAAAKIEWVEGDVLDVGLLEEIMKDTPEVYHSAAVVSFDPRDREALFRVNVGGTANMVNMAMRSNVRKFVHVSSIAAVGRSANSKNINEKTAWTTDKLNSNYALSKYASEQEVWRAQAEGLSTAIVNPSMIMGAGFWNIGTMAFFLNISKGLKYYPLGTNGFVDVRDVAKCMIQLMASDIENERFIINGEDWKYKALFELIAEHSNLTAPNKPATKFLRETAWRLSWLQARIKGGRPMLTKETARTSAEDFFYSNEKIKAALDYEFIPIEQTVKETAPLFIKSMKDSTRFGILDL